MLLAGLGLRCVVNTRTLHEHTKLVTSAPVSELCRLLGRIRMCCWAHCIARPGKGYLSNSVDMRIAALSNGRL